MLATGYLSHVRSDHWACWRQWVATPLASVAGGSGPSGPRSYVGGWDRLAPSRARPSWKRPRSGGSRPRSWWWGSSSRMWLSRPRPAQRAGPRRGSWPLHALLDQRRVYRRPPQPRAQRHELAAIAHQLAQLMSRRGGATPRTAGSRAVRRPATGAICN